MLHSHCWTSLQHSILSTMPFLIASGIGLGLMAQCFLFTLYTIHLSNITSSFNVTHHLCADDTQIYLELDHKNFDFSFAELTECLTCVQKWVDGVKLKLNPEKTEFIIIGDRQFYFPTNTVKKLGVTFNSRNTFTSHTTKMCCACYYHLKELRRIHKCLDYCNSLLYGVSKCNVAKLQKIQNAFCIIVFRLDRTSHVTPFLKNLHWLPITYRILFKYKLTTFKAIKFSQPT